MLPCQGGHAGCQELPGHRPYQVPDNASILTNLINLYLTTNEDPKKIVELPFIVESDVFGERVEGKYRVHDIRKLKKGTALNYVLDVAPESYDEPEILNVFLSAKTIFVNAVMGLVPHFNEGTIALDTVIDRNPHAVKLYGGGDTMQELKRLLPGLYIMALDSKDYYIFTGGGAVLKAIEQNSPSGLAPVRALIEQKAEQEK